MPLLYHKYPLTLLLDVKITLPPEQNVVVPPAVIVGVAGKPTTIIEYVAVAAVQGLLETVIVKVIVFPTSPATAVYVGVNVVAPVIEPPPFSVHNIVPFDEVAPLTVAVPF